jgi:hypothetical protein
LKQQKERPGERRAPWCHHGGPQQIKHDRQILSESFLSEEFFIVSTQKTTADQGPKMVVTAGLAMENWGECASRMTSEYMQNTRDRKGVSFSILFFKE